jgi:hypothetical protein
MRNEVNFILSRSIRSFIVLLKILLPVTILVKILDELGFVSLLGVWLSPVMNLVGLPGEMALVWASGLISSPYAAIFAYTEISKSVPINIAQVTVLSTMLLFAHNMIIETTIGKKIGISILYQLVLRLSAAFLLGIILNQIYLRLNLLTNIAPSIWVSEENSTSLVSWIFATLKNFALTFLVMTGLIALLRAMEKLHLLEYLYKMAEPLLNFFGMSKETAPITIIGMTLGISVGGGLIIDEAQNGKLSRKDIFLVFSMICLVHSLIEDTILMITIGADLSGLLLIRLIFSFVLFLFISRLISIQKIISLDKE